MKIFKIIILSLFLISCSTLLSKKPNHTGAEIINVDISVGRYKNVQKYASYFVASLSAYPEILANENFKKSISKFKPKRNLIDSCSVEKRDYRAPYYVLYSNDDEIRLAYPYLSSCKINFENIKSYISSVNIKRKSIKDKIKEQEAEKEIYRKSEKYAEKSMEQTAIKLIHAENCLSHRMLTVDEYRKEIKRLKVLVKKDANRYYSDKKLKQHKVQVRTYFDPSMGSMYMTTSYDYCRATKYR